MTGRNAPVRTTIEGVEVVILAPEAYERLTTHRRQLGAQTTRIRALNQALIAAAAFLDEIEAAVTQLADVDDEDGDAAEQVRTELKALLEARPEPLRRRPTGV
jgi:hypothetical protein